MDQEVDFAAVRAASGMGTVREWGIRITYWLTLVGLMIASVIWEIRSEAPIESRFGEQSVLEFLQVLCVAVIVGLLWPQSGTPTELRPLQWATVIFFTALMVRELDLWLDLYLFDGAWQLLVSALGLSMMALYYRHPNALRDAVKQLIRRPEWGLLLAGFFVLFMSRLFGMNLLWQAVMGGDYYLRAVKNLVEEGLEMIAYGLLLAAFIEYRLWLQQQPNSPES